MFLYNKKQILWEKSKLQLLDFKTKLLLHICKNNNQVFLFGKKNTQNVLGLGTKTKRYVISSYAPLTHVFALTVDTTQTV